MIRALKNCKYKYKNVISLSTLSFLVRLLKNPIKEHHLEPISKLKQKKRTAPDPGRRNNRSHPDSKHCIYPRSLLLPGSDTECGGPGPASHGPALQAVLRSHITEESMIMIICRFIYSRCIGLPWSPFKVFSLVQGWWTTASLGRGSGPHPAWTSRDSGR